MLPTYQRLNDDVSSTRKDLGGNRTRLLILLLLSMLMIVCLSESRYLTNKNNLSASDELPVWNKNVYPEAIAWTENRHVLSDQKGIDQVSSSSGTGGDASFMTKINVETMQTERVGGAQAMKHGLPDGEDKDPLARSRRNKVKEMALHAWNNYKMYAWGKNELSPLTQRAYTGGMFGANDLGATIVDGIDTLYIMKLNREYEEARDWIAKEFSLDNRNDVLSVFETNIRFVGGLLTMYAFTGDKMFKEKAQHVADKLLPAFQTETGIPYALVNVGTGQSKNYDWVGDGSSIISEFGTMHLEFAYLSDVTGNSLYRDRVVNIRRVLKNMEKPNGLYPSFLNPETGQWGETRSSLGAMGDSFYEYLLKAWIQNGQTESDVRQIYDDAMREVIAKMIRTSPGGLTYIGEVYFDQLVPKMDHLACFAGGMFALGAVTKRDENSEKYMEIGKNITNTCHESYIQTATHLGPDMFEFEDGHEASAVDSAEKFILRPETFESYFVLWRLTKDQKYRDWAWDAIEAIERYCRTPTGYSGITNTCLENPEKDDIQQSFFIAEVLKYLYLIYSDDSLLPLDEWVFNTEAHPLPIKGKNAMYRAEPGNITI